MSADSAILEPAGGPVLRLDFEITASERADLLQQLLSASRHRHLAASWGVLLIAIFAFKAGERFGSDATHSNWSNWVAGLSCVYMIFHGWLLTTNNALLFWISRRFSRGVSHTAVDLDSDGLRGVIENRSSSKKKPATKYIDYAWRKVRKILHPPDYVILEFHGGGTVTIPEREFATHDDLRRCLAWAEDGFAQQRKKPVVRHSLQFVEGE